MFVRASLRHVSKGSFAAAIRENANGQRLDGIHVPGKNTADIRDMSNTQSTFWALAIPVTVTVVAVAMFVAYKGDVVHDFFSELNQNLGNKRLRLKERSTIARRKIRGLPTENEHVREGLRSHRRPRVTAAGDEHVV